MGLRTYTLYQLLKHNASVHATSPAVISGGKIVTHAEFLGRVDRLAAGMESHSINKGDRVCILAQNSLEYFDLYGACAKRGAIAYPINWRLSVEEVGQVLTLAEPSMLVVGAGHLSQLEGHDLSDLKVRVLIGDGEAEGFVPIDELYQDSPSKGVEIDGNDPFVVISTAAVAGLPRGAVLTHDNLMVAGYPVIAALGLGTSDRHLAALPLFHITGLGLSLVTLQVGGANVVMEAFDPTGASKLMDTFDVSMVADFPPILSMLLDAKKESGAEWNHLRYVIGLDAPDVIGRLHQETSAKFVTGFGQSETSGLATMCAVEEKPGSAGRPIPIAEVRCVDSLGVDVAIGEPGEIVVRGPIVFQGYWRDPDATLFTFRHDWHHTGDVGRFDEEGYLYYVGRMPEKDLIKSGGENIYPAEVELVIADLSEVNAVCVIGVPDEEWGEAVKAIVELHPGKSLTKDEVIDTVVGKIASFKKPRHVEFVDALPKLEDGQVDRQAAKEMYG
jgi:acyl-CoA synthetase (AMP-forming)/AMP-acid ligase II